MRFFPCFAGAIRDFTGLIRDYGTSFRDFTGSIRDYGTSFRDFTGAIRDYDTSIRDSGTSDIFRHTLLLKKQQLDY